MEREQCPWHRKAIFPEEDLDHLRSLAQKIANRERIKIRIYFHPGCNSYHLSSTGGGGKKEVFYPKFGAIRNWKRGGK